METAIQVMMGISLAACAGLRAWMPLLLVGLLARFGGLPLHASFDFLARQDVLLAFGVATVLELVGDKIIAVDHFLDAVGTVARPVAGTLLASSMLISLDPATSLTLGLIAGGGAALTVHSGKAMARAQTTALAPAHGGAGNVFLSLAEDIASAVGVGVAIIAPILAFLLTLALLAAAAWIIARGVRHGTNLFRAVRRRRGAP